MELVRGRHNLRPRHRGCAVTIGNFDGVHLGHQAVIEQLMTRARSLGVPGCVVTFEPHPREFFAPERAPARLSRLRDKLAAIERLGVDLKAPDFLTLARGFGCLATRVDSPASLSDALASRPLDGPMLIEVDSIGWQRSLATPQ